MGALTFGTKYGTKYDKKRVRVATGDAASPAPVTTDPGKRLVCLVLIAVAVVVAYNIFIKPKKSA